MTVSVVIPAYRAARTIRRAIDSALGQTAPPTEIVVVDDGSPDGPELAAAVAPYGPAVRLLSKPNGGASSARNFGVAHARSNWIAFLDADDYWEPNKLEWQRGVALAHREVAVVGCRWYEEVPGRPRTRIGEAGSRFHDRILNLQGRAAFDAAMIVWTGSLLVRRDVLGSEPFVSGLEPAEDRDLWVRLLSSRPAFLLSDYLATYVQEPGGISRVNVDRDCGNMLRVVRRHAGLLGRDGVRTEEATVHRRWASVYLAQGNYRKALPHAASRLARQPLSAQAWWIVLKCGFQSVLARRFSAPDGGPT